MHLLQAFHLESSRFKPQNGHESRPRLNNYVIIISLVKSRGGEYVMSSGGTYVVNTISDLFESCLDWY